MICITLSAYSRPCGPVTGGVSDIAVFDPNDFNFTQAGAINGVAQPYTAVTRRAGAVGVGGTAATGTATITNVGADGNIIRIYAPIALGGTLLGEFTKTATESTVTLLAAALKAEINLLTSTHGYSADNVAGVLTITAPLWVGAAINTLELLVEETGTIVATSTAAFSGGVNGTNGKVYLINFQYEEAEWSWKQSVKGCSTKYEHTFAFQLPENSQALTTFLQALDAASCCCGLGMIIRLNGGRIFVCGEKYVNGESIARFKVTQNGSSGTSGKLYDDFNGGNLTLIGNYSRNLYEFTGDWADIEALM